VERKKRAKQNPLTQIKEEIMKGIIYSEGKSFDSCRNDYEIFETLEDARERANVLTRDKFILALAIVDIISATEPHWCEPLKEVTA
jgi:hypothetical protein